MEEAMSQADRVVEMKKLHDQWCRVQDALKAMSKYVCVQDFVFKVVVPCVEEQQVSIE